MCMSNVPHSGTGHVSAKPWDYFRGFSKPEWRMGGHEKGKALFSCKCRNCNLLIKHKDSWICNNGSFRSTNVNVEAKPVHTSKKKCILCFQQLSHLYQAAGGQTLKNSAIIIYPNQNLPLPLDMENAAEPKALLTLKSLPSATGLDSNGPAHRLPFFKKVTTSRGWMELLSYIISLMTLTY